MDICDEIANSTLIPYRKRLASELITFKGGGALCHVFEPKNTQEFLRVIKAFEAFGKEPYILGGGSNVLVADGVVETPVVLTRALDKFRIANGYVFAECGTKIAQIATRARKYGFGGLEFLAGVPLTIGGAVKMNASAFGKQIFDFAKSVFVFSSRACNERVCEIDSQDVDFGYRKGVEGIVLGAKLKLERIDESQSVLATQEYLAKRRTRQPREHSLGSVFKNGEIPSGKLIEACGLKGMRVGGAKISEKHANFIVNTGGATTSDFLALVETCEREVKDKFKIQLEREFKLIQ